MEHIHPNAEQLSYYMESPESREHKDIRIHLMACKNCRSRIDKLAQLELDIKHYAPRFAPLTDLNEDKEQAIERYIDGHLDEVQGMQVQQRIHNDHDALKSALHYAVHSAAMSKNIDTMNINPANIAPAAANAKGGAITGLLHRLIQSLQWPTPAWVVAPASLAVAALISYTFTASMMVATQQLPRIAAFQDNATISFQQAGVPAGSIGFFHGAQTRSEPFTGIDITVIDKKNLTLQWQPIANATQYNVEIYINRNGERIMVTQQDTDATHVTLNNIELLDGKHYEWQLSGKTQDGLQFQTRGDFIYYKGLNS